MLERLKEMLGSAVGMAANLDRSEIGVLGATWKSKKFGAMTIWCVLCVEGAMRMFALGAMWPGVAIAGMGTATVCFYLHAQGKVDEANGG